MRNNINNIFVEGIREKEARVLFKCDGKKLCGKSVGCGVNSIYGDCKHTVDIEHAVSQKYRDQETLDTAILNGRFRRIDGHSVYLPIQYWEK